MSKEKLPVISGKDTVKIFQALGWVFVRYSKKRHMILKKLGERTLLSVPDHKKLDRGLLHALIKDAGITVEEFIKML